MRVASDGLVGWRGEGTLARRRAIARRLGAGAKVHALALTHFSQRYEALKEAAAPKHRERN
jgi:hypothetical protein